MPKRWCAEPGCRKLFDKDATGTTRCPACQARHDQQRKQRQPTASRGYGSAHQAERERLIAAFQPGQPCALCGKPLLTSANLDLAHNSDRTGWLGLAHQACNRATNKGNR